MYLIRKNKTEYIYYSVNFPVEYVHSIYFLILVTVHCSSSAAGRINKRFYDAFELVNDDEPNSNGGVHHKGSNRDDPCKNKPLCFLKSQRKLGKLSPLFHCLEERNLD